MIDLFNEILQTLRHNKVRTALTGIAVAWGIFLLIVLLGLSRGLLNGTMDSFDTGAMRNITMWGGKTNMAYEGYREGRSIDFDDKDLPAISDVTRGTVRGAIGSLSKSADVSSDKERVDGTLRGVSADSRVIDNIEVTTGRYINRADELNRRRTMLIEEHNVPVLFGSDEPDKAVGKNLKAFGLSWLVVGVYRSEWRRDFIVPYPTMAALSGANDSIDNIQLLLADDVDVPASKSTAEAAKSAVAKRHHFNPEDPSALYIRNGLEGQEQGLMVIDIMTIAVWVIGLLTLLSGIVGVSNIMFVSVRERTHEIGVRRAIGARPRSILTQIIAESVAITTLFGYLGIFGGIVVTSVFAMVQGNSNGFRDPTVDLSIAVEVTVVLIVVGVLAGLFPAIKATKVQPVEALRDE